MVQHDGVDSMASVYAQNSRGKVGYRVQFVPANPPDRDTRSSLWLGTNRTKEESANVGKHIDAMVEAIERKEPYPKLTREWLRSIDADLHEKLAGLGFCESKNQAKELRTLEMLIERFKKTILRKKPGTIYKLNQIGDDLLRYPGFSGSKKVSDITEGEAEEWAEWLAANGNTKEAANGKLADNTVRRRCGAAKQVFAFAIKLKWIQENPFSGLVCTVRRNSKRMQMIPADAIEAILKKSECPSLSAIVALARYGGLRIPSELVGLTWRDIDFDASAGSVFVRSPKTEHHEGKESRVCPLFPELRPHLEKLHADAITRNAADSDEFLFPGISTKKSFHARFCRLIKRAGYSVWPKLFQNLRASRQSELLAHGHPVKDVCEWIGNTEAVAMEHYAMTSADAFRRAVAIGANIVGNPANTVKDTIEETAGETAKSVVRNVGRNVGLSDALNHNQAIAGESTEGAGDTANPMKTKGFEGKRGRLITLAKRASEESNRRGGTTEGDENTLNPQGNEGFSQIRSQSVGRNVGLSGAIDDTQTHSLKLNDHAWEQIDSLFDALGIPLTDSLVSAIEQASRTGTPLTHSEPVTRHPSRKSSNAR
jgi:integrase